MTYELPYINEGTFDCKFNIITEPLHLTEKVSDEFCRCEPNKQLLETVSNRTHFSYKYEPLSSFSTKKAASSFNKSENNELFFANATPEFTHSESLTAAEKGTAVHRFMEVCDFELAKNDVPAEIERLVSLGKLTQQQADVIDTDSINQFFESPLFKRIEASPKVLREQKFTMFVPISFSQPQLDEEFADEKILVQGVIDCAFFENNRIVVLDYKTDRVKSADELAEIYTNQLQIYKLAAEKLFNTEVSQLLLYSFKLSEEKEIKI
jgi:ATP-dependent helicase/nuclease subunit A